MLKKSIVLHIQQFSNQIQMIPILEMPFDNNTTIPIPDIMTRNLCNLVKSNRLNRWLTDFQ